LEGIDYQKMDEKEYLDTRLNNQINWYDKKSKNNQKYYKWLKRIEFILSASIPVITLITTIYYNDTNIGKITIAIIGSVLTILAAIHGLSDFHEHWIEYRSISETLKHEKYLYLTNSGIYSDSANPFALLVERTEQLISKENVNWAAHNKKQKAT
jgi:hypothetical protein